MFIISSCNLTLKVFVVANTRHTPRLNDLDSPSVNITTTYDQRKRRQHVLHRTRGESPLASHGICRPSTAHPRVLVGSDFYQVSFEGRFSPGYPSPTRALKPWLPTSALPKEHEADATTAWTDAHLCRL